MDKLETLLAQCDKSLTNTLGRKKYDKDLLKAIIKGLGPSVYKKDSLKVACSNAKERDRIKKSFLIKKLGLPNGPELDDAIKQICQDMGSSNRNKYRPVFYYLLVEKFGKQAVYITPSASDTKEETKAKSSAKSSGAQKKSTASEKKKKTIHIPMTDDIIRKHALYAAGAGLIPIPLIDLASISAVQYKMIKAIAAKYDHVEFSAEKTKSVIAGLMGGVTSFEAGIITRLLFRGIPIIGPVIGGTAISGFAYATTKLIGEIFDEHFATGGDLAVEELTLIKMREKLSFNFDAWKDSKS